MADDILTANRVLIRPGGASQDEALTETARLLEEAGAVTAAYLDAMRERERTVSTFMGNGLAIPHGTNDAKDEILSSALSVIRYDGGVDWAGDEVSFVVGIAGKGDEHLEILSRIALLFSEEDEVARLRAAATPEELFALISSAGI